MQIDPLLHLADALGPSALWILFAALIGNIGILIGVRYYRNLLKFRSQAATDALEIFSRVTASDLPEQSKRAILAGMERRFGFSRSRRNPLRRRSLFLWTFAASFLSCFAKYSDTALRYRSFTHYQATVAVILDVEMMDVVKVFSILVPTISGTLSILIFRGIDRPYFPMIFGVLCSLIVPGVMYILLILIGVVDYKNLFVRLT